MELLKGIEKRVIKEDQGKSRNKIRRRRVEKGNRRSE